MVLLHLAFICLKFDSPELKPRKEARQAAGAIAVTIMPTDGGQRSHRERLQCRDDGARALRAVFSSFDNWLNLSEAERDEWRGYFDRMLEWLHHLGYTHERNPCSILLKDSTTGRALLKGERLSARK